MIPVLRCNPLELGFSIFRRAHAVIDPSETDKPISDASDVVIVTGVRSDAKPSPSATALVRPRLGVAHLLVWVGCCGAFMGLARTMADRPSGTLGAIFLTLVAAGYGAAWAGLIVTLARTLRGAPWSIEPGQWLLSICGVVTIVEVLGEIASPRWLRNPMGVVQATAMCAYIVPLLDKRLASRWKWMFGALSLAYALPLVTSLLIGQMNLPNLLIRAAANLTPKRLAAIAAAAAIALALFDRFHFGVRGKRTEQRGWLHWTGIVTVAWLAVLPLAASWVLRAL
jgi:hypothetical protein